MIGDNGGMSSSDPDLNRAGADAEAGAGAPDVAADDRSAQGFDTSDAAPPIDAHTEPGDPERAVEVSFETEVVSVRRAPRVSRFLIMGAVLGALVALVLALAFPENAEFTTAQVFGFLLLLCATVGVALGGLAAVIIDSSSARRAESVTAERSSAIPASPAADDSTAPDGRPSL